MRLPRHSFAGVVYARVSQVRTHALTTRARKRGLSRNATLCELLGRGLAKSAQPPLEKRIRATCRPAGPGPNEIKPCRRMRERRRVRDADNSPFRELDQ